MAKGKWQRIFKRRKEDRRQSHPLNNVDRLLGIAAEDSELRAANHVDEVAGEVTGVAPLWRGIELRQEPCVPIQTFVSWCIIRSRLPWLILTALRPRRSTHTSGNAAVAANHPYLIVLPHVQPAAMLAAATATLRRLQCADRRRNRFLSSYYH